VSESLYSIISDNGDPVSVSAILFEGPYRSEFLGTPISERIRVTTPRFPGLELGPLRLRIERAGVALLDTSARLIGWVGDLDATVLEFELNGGESG
jgi:hypothetical protein